jgi:hypothetical protein
MNPSPYQIIPQAQHAPPVAGAAPHLAGVRHVLLVSRLYQPVLVQAATLHLNNPGQYHNAWQQAMAQGAILHLANVSGTYDGGVTRWSSAPALAVPRRVVAVQHTLRCTDVLNPANNALAQSLAADVHRVCWFATHNGLFNAGVPCAVTVGMPVGTQADQVLGLQYEITWQTLALPQWLPLPAFLKP